MEAPLHSTAHLLLCWHAGLAHSPSDLYLYKSYMRPISIVGFLEQPVRKVESSVFASSFLRLVATLPAVHLEASGTST